MSEALVVLLLVLATGEASSATSSIVASAQRGLGPDARLLVEQRGVLPSDDEALRLAGQVHASAVVEVALSSTGARAATLHVHTDAGSGWTDRVIEFAPQESPNECGRTLGFAVSSMITRLTTPTEATTSASQPVIPAPAPASGPVAPPAVTPPPAPAPPVAPASATPPSAGPAFASPPRGPSNAFEPRYAVEAMGIGTAIGAASSTLGMAVSGQAAVLPRLGIQLDVSARSGDVQAAQANYQSLQVGAGAAWQLLSTGGRRRLELDLRGDVYGCDLIVERGGETRSRWLAGGTLVLEGAWFVVARNVGVVAAAGADASFGATRLAVGPQTVALISPFRGLAALGIRVRF